MNVWDVRYLMGYIYNTIFDGFSRITLKMIEGLLIIITSLILIFCSFLAISCNNGIYAVLYLILVFVNSSILFFVLGIEYLAVSLIIVYVGAIAILFLFVVMMLNLKQHESIEVNLRFLPLVFFFALISFILLLTEGKIESNVQIGTDLTYVNYFENLIRFPNLSNIGLLLFDEGLLYFILAGYILLLAMIAAIALTFHMNMDVKRQSIFTQTSRHYWRSVKLES